MLYILLFATEFFTAPFESVNNEDYCIRNIIISEQSICLTIHSTSNLYSLIMESVVFQITQIQGVIARRVTV